ncbi:hypothetical protein CVV68_01440 [Arthrobacter livingstonensis]|uniref:Helicase-associated domain-containing protein n=1 Tax=Arthrobacter livingstonensis TaxID=670078 RepID=A0A2V5LE58_9MICC|nr:helicase associated domain-containing protein [Arthrobacter livingstonensis]PYI69798.1 hypothetical protein CVV68_01440 [Arthrobacter livingstonensis]
MNTANQPLDPVNGTSEDSEHEPEDDVLSRIEPPTVEWLKRLAELKAFLVVHDRFPSRNGPERGEQSVNAWLSQQRHAFMEHRLTWNQAAAMGVLGDWITTDLEFTNDTHWRQRLDELVEFHKEHSRLPNRRHCKSHEEDVLGVWLQTQVSQRNRGLMPQWRLDAMNEVFPGWSEPRLV